MSAAPPLRHPLAFPEDTALTPLSLRNALTLAREGILNNDRDADIQRWCRWIMQRLIQACATLATDGVTRRKVAGPELCVLFARRYPGTRVTPYLRQAIEWAEEPTAHLGKLLPFLKRFGRWVVREMERRA
jgi:hypothetical protein